MWNPLYGTRGGVPYGGACLPKDTVAFLQFASEHGFEHLMLGAAIDVNQRLAQHIPAAASPDKIDDVLAVAQSEDAGEQGLAIELGGQKQPVIL